ncbi:aspartate 1-decarboxylase [Clostridium sp. KNHs205]|jgi:aspartate 1-decarboxylase|uniref:aspartate 1-decarboxylase n=1 Tax=Clostridium sp. KNHs205 TaxID=1449050 RepID=UPI00051AD210|nr:aspartate 1-decarboxylase [Clostridium sp. KNHs205]
MQIFMLKSKIHRAIVTSAELNYVGSITIDKALMQAADINEYEKVQVVNIDNGNRFETYVIEGKTGSGIIGLNGAAARLAVNGDRVIIMTYCLMEDIEAKKYVPKIVMVNKKNEMIQIENKEIHGDCEI